MSTHLIVINFLNNYSIYHQNFKPIAEKDINNIIRTLKESNNQYFECIDNILNEELITVFGYSSELICNAKQNLIMYENNINKLKKTMQQFIKVCSIYNQLSFIVDYVKMYCVDHNMSCRYRRIIQILCIEKMDRPKIFQTLVALSRNEITNDLIKYTASINLMSNIDMLYTPLQYFCQFSNSNNSINLIKLDNNRILDLKLLQQDYNFIIQTFNYGIKRNKDMLHSMLTSNINLESSDSEQ